MPCDQDKVSDILPSQSTGAEDGGRIFQELDADADTLVVPTVDSKSMVETVKGHLIGTNKLQRYLETAKKQNEVETMKVSSLMKVLETHSTENKELKERLLKEKTAIMELEDKLAHLDDSGDSCSACDSLQNDLTLALEQLKYAESRLGDHERYTKQLEAQLMELDAQHKAVFRPPPKRSNRMNQAIATRERRIKELQQALINAQGTKKATDDDTTEMAVTNRRLQRDHDDLVEAVKKQKRTHEATMGAQKRQPQHQQQQEAPFNTTTHAGVSSTFLDDMRRELQGNHIFISQMQRKVESLQQSSNPAYSDLIADFKSSLYENETLKKEKRILQDRLTELWVTEEGRKTSRRRALLAHHGLLKSSPLDHQYRSGSNQSTGATWVQFSPNQRPSLTASPTETAAKKTSSHDYMQLSSSLPTTSLQQTSGGSDSSATPIRRKRRRIIISDTSESESPSPSSRLSNRSPSFSFSSSSSTDSDSDASFVPSSSKVATGRQKAVKAKPSSLTPKVAETSLLSLLESIQKPSETATTASNETTPMKKTLESIKLRAEQLALKPPTDGQHLLYDMGEYTGRLLDTFLSSMAAMLPRFKSPGAPLSMLSSNSQKHIDTCSHGADGLIFIHGCPNYIVLMEKNLAWSLWALLHLYPQNNLYPRVMKWAGDAAVEAGIQGRVNLACRYTRIFMLLCKNANDKQRASVFCYDLMRRFPRNINIMTPMLNVALIWPELLDLGIDSPALIVRTIQQCCAHFCNTKKEATPKDVKAVYDYLVILVHWPELQHMTHLYGHIIGLGQILASPAFKGLYHSDRNAFNDTRINLIKALELAFWRLDEWKYTYTKFILPDVLPLLKDTVLASVCLEIIGVLIPGGLQSGRRQEKTGVALLLNKLKDVLDTDNGLNSDFALQCLAAKSLLLLSKGDTSLVNFVFRWFDGIPPTLMKTAPAHLVYGVVHLRCLNKIKIGGGGYMNSNNRIGRIEYDSECSDETGITVFVEELMDSAYGYYVWPSSLVLSNYVWHHRDMFKNKTILEVGAGTCLPSLVLTKIDSAPHLVVTDIPSIIPVARACLKLNGIDTIPINNKDTFESSTMPPVWVRGLEWGDIESANGVKQLLEDMDARWDHRKLDYILGSDTFYEPSDFEKLLMTVAYVIHRHNNRCKFITAYQERSSKRSIQFLLDKWSLHCRLIPRETFGFNGSDDDGAMDDEKETPRIPHVKTNTSTLVSVFLLEIYAKPGSTMKS